MAERRDPGNGETSLVSVELALSILGYQEKDEWVALALEMDLRGYGATFDEALTDLRDLVNMQISFAVHKQQPGLIWKHAEPAWWSLFADKRRDRFEALVTKVDRDPGFEVAELGIPPAHVIEVFKAGFKRVDA